MEFVRVLYPTSRAVEVDNTVCGQTNEVLFVETGTHRFDLGQPVDYEPAFKTVTVSGTVPNDPLSILFDAIVPAGAPTSGSGE
jgi:hypothetical protein